MSYKNPDQQKESLHNYYLNNKAKFAKRMSDSRKRNQQYIYNYKSNHPCIKCSETTPECLDFHHLDPKEKDTTISAMRHGIGIKTIDKEIAKCVILCANCHRKFHANLITI